MEHPTPYQLLWISEDVGQALSDTLMMPDYIDQLMRQVAQQKRTRQEVESN